MWTATSYSSLLICSYITKLLETLNDLKERQPWHFSVRALLLLDVRLPFHLNALPCCLMVYTNGIPLSIVFQNLPLSTRSLFQQRKKTPTTTWKTRTSLPNSLLGFLFLISFGCRMKQRLCKILQERNRLRYGLKHWHGCRKIEFNSVLKMK